MNKDKLQVYRLGRPSEILCSDGTSVTSVVDVFQAHELISHRSMIPYVTFPQTGETKKVVGVFVSYQDYSLFRNS